MDKRSEKIITWRRHHLGLDITIQKEKSPCRHADEVVDVVVVVLIFNRAAMEKIISPFPFTVAGEEEEINL